MIVNYRKLLLQKDVNLILNYKFRILQYWFWELRFFLEFTHHPPPIMQHGPSDDGERRGGGSHKKHKLAKVFPSRPT